MSAANPLVVSYGVGLDSTASPASKPSEVVELKRTHPELYQRAVAIERSARDGKHGLTTKAGLGLGGWSWEWLANVDDPSEAAAALKARGAKVSDGLRP